MSIRCQRSLISLCTFRTEAVRANEEALAILEATLNKEVKTRRGSLSARGCSERERSADF